MLFSDYHSIPRRTGSSPTPRRCSSPGSIRPGRRDLRDIAFTDHDRYHEGVDFDAISRLRENNPDVRDPRGD